MKPSSKKAKFFYLAMVLAVVASLLTFGQAFSAESVDQSYEPNSFSRTQIVGNVNGVQFTVFQTFKAGQNGPLTGVKVYKTSATGTANTLGLLRAEIVATDSNGRPTGATLTSGSIPNPANNAWATIPFANDLHIKSGDVLAIKMSCLNCASGTFYRLGSNITSTSNLAYLDGSVFTQRSNNRTIFNNASEDLGFATLMEEASKNADLSALSVSEGTLSPSFEVETLEYDVTVPYATDSIQLKGSLDDVNAVGLTINGSSVKDGEFSSDINLVVGETSIPVVVTAEDGASSKIYTVNVTREEPSTEADLSALVTSSGELDQTFAEETYSYSVDVENEVSEIKVTPTSVHAGAKISIDGSDVVSGSASAPIALAVGDNTITVNITAEDSTTTSSYTLNVYRSPVRVSIDAPADASVTSDQTPEMKGTVYGGASLNVKVEDSANNSVFTDSVTADNTGAWSSNLTSDLSEGSYTLTVTDAVYPKNKKTVSFNIDLTGPEITYETNVEATNNWFNEDVTFTFECSDAAADVAECPEPVTVDTEGTDQSFEVTATDTLGNSKTIKIEDIDLDKTAPTITGYPTSDPNNYGWYNAPVTVTFVCQDDLSGYDACENDQTLTTEGLGQSAVGSVTDVAGNTATFTVENIDIDLSGPEVETTISGTKNGDWYNTDVTVDFTCTDSLSDVVDCPEQISLTTDGSYDDISATVTDLAENSTTINVEEIKIDKTTPTMTAEVVGGTKTNGWYTQPVTVKFTCDDTGSGVVSCPDDVVLDESGADQSVTKTVSDNAGNTFEVKVEDIDIDLELAEITFEILGTQGENGWYTSDVTVDFTCTDDAAGVKNCPQDITYTANGTQAAATYSVVDNVERSAVDAGVNVPEIKIDKTAPVITASVSGTPNQAGWYNQPVTVTFTCTDIGSTVNTCTSPVELSTNGANNTATGTVKDFAGNTATVTTNPIKIDLNAPSKINNLSSINVTSTSVRLSWSAATDNNALDDYSILRNGQEIAKTKLTDYLDQNLQPNTTYEYTIVARDVASNTTSSNTISAKTLANNEVTVYYRVPAAWNGIANIHYARTGGTWTTLPGVRMNTSNIYPGFAVLTINLNTSSGIVAAFNNNNNVWDNNGTKNYSISAGIFTISNGVLTQGTPPADTTAPTVPAGLASSNVATTSLTISWSASTDASGIESYTVFRNGQQIGTTTNTTFNDTNLTANTTYTYTVSAKDKAGNNSAQSASISVKTLANTSNTVTVFYKVPSGTVSNIHYRPIGGTWTTSPGVAMTPSNFAGFNTITLSIGSATGIEAAFNNNAGVWDSNSSKNYLINAGTFTVIGSSVIPGQPDLVAPSVPQNLVTTNVQGTAVSLKWDASTDPSGIRNYVIFRNGTRIATMTITSFTNSNLTLSTGYTYTIAAVDNFGNQSAQSAPLAVTTAANNTLTVYYKVPSGTVSNIHWARLGTTTWTALPGTKMNASNITGFNVITLNIGSATGINAAFNNNAGVWDSNGGLNYTINMGVATVNAGKVTVGLPQ